MRPAIIVTGAASGIGRELARVAAYDGCAMVLVDRSPAGLESLAADLAADGREVHALAIDLAHSGATAAIESALHERGLYCDVLVNNAGFGLFGPAVEIDRTRQLGLLDVNVRAPTELILRFLPGMVARGRGGVLNVGSIAAYTPGPGMAMYHASKAFVRSLSAALAAEIAGTGVTVTCLSPGVVRTPFFQGMPIKSTRLFKFMPRSHASSAAEAGWRGFRAGKRLVFPRLIDRVFAACLAVLPARAVPRVQSDVKQAG